MQNFIKFILKNHFFMLFILLESFAIFLTIKQSKIKTGIVLSSANNISGFFYNRISKYTEYFSLKEQNKLLSEDNIRLRNELPSSFFADSSISFTKVDTMKKRKYLYRSATIIKNSVIKKNNFITINKGTNQGIEENSAVLAPSGVVGIVAKTGKNYSLVISLLNTKVGISGKLKKNEYFGSVIWDGFNYRFATLNEIPNHIKINIGDTVVSSGYSSVFPPDIPIGTVIDYKLKGENNFYDIKIKLSVDFKKIKRVYIVKNLMKDEELELEKHINDFE